MLSLGTFLIYNIRLRTPIRCLFLFLIPCVCGVENALAQTYPASWPLDSSWTSYTQLGAVLQDIATSAGDQTDGGTGVNPDSADVYNGTSGNLPSVYFYYDSSSQVLFFRMRLRGNPQQGGQSELQNGTWNAILDTDGDGYKEFFVELNGNSTDTLNIYYGDTNQQNIVSADCSDGEGRVSTLSAVMNTHYRITAATGGGFFLDFQAPLSGFDNCGGTQVVTTSTSFSLVFTTSATAQNPTQKDLTGPGDYIMAATKMLPFGDSLTLGGGITQNPVVSGMTHACGGGTNFDPITLTATVLDTLGVSGSGSGASVVDSISSVTFSYRISGSSTYTQIAQINAPVSGTVNTWRATWSTASFPSTTFAVRVVVVDDQGNQTADNSYAIDLGTCSKVAAPTSVEIVSFTAMDDGKGRVLLRWETGNELDNLGFNLYRDEKGRRTLINPDLIAGSAFLTAPGISLQAGYSYSFSDFLPRRARHVQYWVEDFDLSGHSTLHGPFALEHSDSQGGGTLPRNSPLLNSLADLRVQAQTPGSAPVELSAVAPAATADLVAAHSIGSGPSLKVAVQRAGWYRIPQPQLLASGLSPWVNPRMLQMFVDGGQVPILVRGESDSRLDASDSVEFFGVGLDSQFSKSRIYYLVAGSQPGLRINPASSSSGKGGTTAPPSKGKSVVASSSSFPFSVERRDKTFFFSSLLNGEADNFFGSVISSSVLEQSLVLSNVDFSSGSEATIEVVLQGVTLAAHQVAVTLNDQSLGSITFADRQKGMLSLNIPHGLLREGQNVVRLARQAGSNDVSLVEVIRITYQHAFKADSDSLFLTASPGQQVSISGFTTPSLLLLDVTDLDQASGLSASVSLDPSGSYRLSASVVAKTDRRLFAVADTQARQVESLTADRPSNLRSTSNGANLVIITRSDLIASLGQLKAYRQSRGLSVMIVDVEDIYDEFSFGHKTPFAIREFLRLTQSWKKAPRFVLLAGDGTFDPRDYVGGGSADLVPIKLVETKAMETASDDWYADFDQDGVADIALGRLPVRSSQEISKITAKIIAFEQGPRFDSAMLISDVDRIYDFDAATQDVRRHIPDSVRVDEVSRGQMGDAAARAKILESISAGSTLINYIGHGTLRAWGGGLLTAGDTAGLLNGNRPALFVLMTCLNGLFQNPDSDSFAEALVRADAGAVAVWASSGLTRPNEQTLMNQELVRQLFAREVSTIGEAIRRAKMHVGDPDIRRTWILFGDPATSVR